MSSTILVLPTPAGTPGTAQPVAATVTVESGMAGERQAFLQAGSPAFRAVPFLRVVEDKPRRVAVGQVRVFVAACGAVHLTVNVAAAWVDLDGGWAPEPVHHWQAASVAPILWSSPVALPPMGRAGDRAEWIAASLATSLTEESRNSVGALRAVRYELEAALAAGARDDRAGRQTVLAELLDLGLAVSRARDQARAAYRDGFWTWLSDDEAYHRYRKTIDATHFTPHLPADLRTRPWMRLHDTGLRQCRAMEEQLGEESAIIYNLLAAASTIEASREARAQERLNDLLAIGGPALGVPALILTVYSVERLRPASLESKTAALVFIGALAGLVTLLLLKSSSRSQKWSRFGLALAVLGILTGVLFLATYLSPGPP